jgi:hypothetical protein
VSGETGDSPPAVPDTRRARLEEAAADLRVARSRLLGVSDPRTAGAYLEAMRSCVTEIAELAEDELAAVTPAPAAGPGRAAPAGNVLAACGPQLGAVDHLLAGITEARRQPARLWRAGGDQEAFATGGAVLRLLLADRADAGAESRELLQAAREYLRNPHAPVTEPGGQEGTAHSDGGTAGAPETGETLE